MKDQVKNLTEKGIFATALVENISEELIEQVNYLYKASLASSYIAT